MKQQKMSQPGTVRLLLYRGEFPWQAVCLNLNKAAEQVYLNDLVGFVANEPGWGLCEFKDEDSYQQGRRLVGQHHEFRRSGKRNNSGDWIGIQIGKFQGLVQPLSYQRLPLTKGQKEAIREDHESCNYSIAKLAEDWDVSESHIREVLKGDKPPVCPPRDPINIDSFVGEPPIPGRVVPEARGLPR
ncbi:MAG: hypothetical protein QF877_14130 [Gammaproteobacteria bacterium]|jgi:hypothetical protein|nr:hypothetical protein [Gammaproteobacteria bacterium]|tara:strand:+ start:436 stop:993 length:558 start_codon:yes stop_codon:yes gene_type:complete